MPSHDISAPGYQIKVISTQVNLRGKDRVEDFTEFVTKFTFEDSDEEHDVLKLEVDNHDLRFFDDPVWAKGNLIQFYFGYPGRISARRIHVIDNMRGFETLTITAIEQAGLVNKEKCRKFENKTRIEVVLEVLKTGNFGQVKNFNVEASAITAEGKRDWYQAGTDWKFLQRLAEKVSYQVYITGDTLHFHPRRLAQKPVRKFEYFFGFGDLKRFRLKEYRVADRPAEVEVFGWDHIKRKILKAIGSDSTTERDTLGNKGSLVFEIDSEGKLAARRVISTPETNQAIVDQEAAMHFKRAEEVEVEATAEIIGDPLLSAKNLVKIEGISKTLSGLYYIKKHVHELSRSGGYRGTMEVIKNATVTGPRSDPSSLDPSKAKENRSDVDDNPGVDFVLDDTGALIPQARDQ